MSDDVHELMRALHGDDYLKDPPDGGKVRQKDQPWKALGISRATWYRQNKPTCGSELDARYYYRQKNRAQADDRSIRTIQRRAFVERWGIPELSQLAVQDCLPPAMLEEIVAWWGFPEQQAFFNRLVELSVDAKKEFKPNDRFLKMFGSAMSEVLSTEESHLRRLARQAKQEIEVKQRAEPDADTETDRAA